jgi:hypothetical protein
MVDATMLPATVSTHFTTWLTFTPLMPGDTVTKITSTSTLKITLPDADDNTATDIVVPLWPETKAAWKSHDLPGTWLLVQCDQQWFVELCNRAELSRHERSGFAAYIKNTWLASMVVEKVASHGTGTADSDIDPTSQVTPLAHPRHATITIAVDGFRVTYLKYQSQLAFRLDADVLRFIPGYLYSQALKFRASPQRNVRARKVCWNKHEARWDVHLTTGEQLSGPCVDGLSVDKSLPFEEFLAQKMSSHQRAVDLWNEKDPTNRTRIARKIRKLPKRNWKAHPPHCGT